MNDIDQVENEAIDRERYEALQQIEEWLEWPVLVLGFTWLVLLVIELIWGLNPFLDRIVLVIWAVFVIDFVIRFILAPKKLLYIKNNWLSALSLFVPALRVLRIARLAQLLRLTRTARGLRLLKVVSSLNRGMRALRASMGRRGFGYIALLTLVITLVGAAGMFAFENEGSLREGFSNYGDALYWTAMVMTTLGSEYWPKSAEGRVLGFLLAVYAFAVFGYVTATLATYFIGRDADAEQAELVGEKSLEVLRAEIKALRAEVQALTHHESRET